MAFNFEIDWFDQLQVNFLQAPEGMLGIHAYKEGYGCVYFEVPEEWLKDDRFFRLVRAEAQIQWMQHKHRPRRDEFCPVCNRQLSGFQFRYRGQIFCRSCGSWLNYDPATEHYSLVRSILK